MSEDIKKALGAAAEIPVDVGQGGPLDLLALIQKKKPAPLGSEPAFPCGNATRAGEILKLVKHIQASKSSEEAMERTLDALQVELQQAVFYGLTKRELFVFGALIGQTANTNYDPSFEVIDNFKTLASHAVQTADEVLKILEKKE